MPILDAETLIRAYASGLFPMALNEGSDERTEIGWFSPDPRGVIPLETFHIPRGLKRALRKQPFEIRFDTDFAAVIAGCADRDETWISREISEAYTELHRMGFAHSVEAWRDDELVGGLYGVALGGAFFGESMFSRATDASKIALVALVERMCENGYVLLDTQWTNPHLKQFGCLEIPRDEYLRQLDAALRIHTDLVEA